MGERVLSIEERVEREVRGEIIQGLAHPSITDAHRLLFRRMYSHDDLERPIPMAVELMPREKLDNALDQVLRTLTKLATKEAPDGR